MFKKDLEERIEQLTKIKDLAQEETNKFKEIRENRNDKKSKKNVEQQSSDMGRLQEPDIQD